MNFETELTSAILKKVQQCKKQGTTSMTIENLRQMTRPPGAIAGAPAGPAAYNNMFANICQSNKTIRQFVTN